MSGSQRLSLDKSFDHLACALSEIAQTIGFYTGRNDDTFRESHFDRFGPLDENFAALTFHQIKHLELVVSTISNLLGKFKAMDSKKELRDIADLILASTSLRAQQEWLRVQVRSDPGRRTSCVYISKRVIQVHVAQMAGKIFAQIVIDLKGVNVGGCTDLQNQIILAAAMHSPAGD